MRRAVVAASVVGVLLLAGVSALLVLPAYRSSQRHSNEQSASAALKTLATAEADFRANDRDENKVQDFWTGDVAGLYYLKPQGSDEPVKLIEKAIADADPSRPGAKPFHGYWFVAMDKDEDGKPYRQDTEGVGTKGLLKYHPSKFAFCAYPAEPGVTGVAVFALNENNTIFKNLVTKAAVLKWPSEDGEDDVVPGEPLPLIALSHKELKRSTVVPVLEAGHADGRNLLWCITLPLAWDAMAKDIRDPNPTLVGGPAYVAQLNARTTGKDLLKDSWYVAVSGSIGEGVARRVREQMAAKFPGVPVPIEIPETGDPLQYVAFAYLRRLLKFNTPFERYPEEFRFDGRSVSAFGLRAHGPRAAAMSQVLIHTYASPQDFTVELATSSEDDRLVLARLPRKATLIETVRAALGRAPVGGGKAMESQDEFRVPCFNFDLHWNFAELERKKFVQGTGIGDTLTEAFQVNQFLLDENGVKLVSYAKLSYSMVDVEETPPPPPPPKKLICDGPFLFLMLRKGAPLPYFAMWIENAELLCPK